MCDLKELIAYITHILYTTCDKGCVESVADKDLVSDNDNLSGTH
ncbi:hypothetical protein Hanom_Chr16g01429761 [Helianthus anomalus]